MSVVHRGIEYVAYDYMMEVPSIDSISFINEIKEAGGPTYFMPTIYFKEPQNQSNNYLFQLIDRYDDRFQLSNRVWRYSILSDKTLEPYVKGLQIDDGASPDGHAFYPISIGDTLTVRMSSLSLGAFKYFESLIKQFEYDGGAYKPSPASPPTNLSNGALGFFRASSITSKSIVIE